MGTKPWEVGCGEKIVGPGTSFVRMSATLRSVLSVPTSVTHPASPCCLTEFDVKGFITTGESWNLVVSAGISPAGTMVKEMKG